jgi:ABC-type nickel/cobalt efflux system permease component RcnA
MVVALGGLRPATVAAHPLDEYQQAAYLTLATDGVTLELDLSPGVLVAPQVIAAIDTDGDGAISEQEGQTYARVVLSDVRLEVDEQPHPLTLTRVELPTMLALTSGLGTLRLEAAAVSGPNGGPLVVGPGPHEALLQNRHAPVKSVYQATVALGAGGGIEVSQQRRDDLQQRLQVAYAVAPPSFASAAPVAMGSTGSAGAEAVAALPADALGGQRWLVDALYQPVLSPWLLLVALALSALLGGLHALTPGHGKTLLASYLVGSRGTARHAVVLGGTVTFTHTASVIATGLLALLAGRVLVPSLLVPALELGSGLLVVVLGVRLVLARWHALRRGSDHEHDHAHPHAHGSEDAHAHVGSVPSFGHRHAHGHGPETSPHSHPPSAPSDMVRWRDLAAMGVSGGLTPCPEAIGILLIAIGLNRVALGMGLIVAFSLGLAAVLCLLGLLLVRARGLADRVGGFGAPLQRLLPLGSAVVVTLLGAAITTQAVLAYLA